jgi:uncharacterized membrane protein YidH (DUF202 family)
MGFWEWFFTIYFAIVIAFKAFEFFGKQAERVRNRKAKNVYRITSNIFIGICVVIIVAVFLLIAGALWYYFGGFLFFDGDEPFYKIIGSILGVLGVLLIISGIITIFKK